MGYGHPWAFNMTQNPDPGSFKNASSSGVDSRSRMAKIWIERVGGAVKALDDGLVALLEAQGVLQAWLWLHLPQLSFKPVTRLNTGLAPAT
jgi:hypothetical protein